MEADNSNSESRKIIKKSLDDYEVVNHPTKSTPDLGKGSYGCVKLVKEKGKGDKLYAMKIVSI